MSVIDRETLAFQLYDVFGLERLCAGRFADHDRTSLDAVLDLAERISTDHLWSHAAQADREEPELVNGRTIVLPAVVDALGVLRGAGFFVAHCDYELGGMQLPATVLFACNGMMKATNPATHAYMSLTRAAANLLAVHGNEAQRKVLMQPMLEGRFFGTMCLSEPDAGSSLADIRTRAEPREDGTYAITGSKMWISGGDQNISETIVHLVLARLPDALPGPKGISLFAVPRDHVRPDGTVGGPNGVVTAGLNHKMGYRGTTNCLLSFGADAPAVGTLVGEPGAGLSCMFHMMNEARISVGIGGAMLGLAGLRLSLNYAKDRKQGRPLGVRGNGPVPITEHPDVMRMLLRQKALAEGAMALCLWAGTLIDRAALTDDDDERERLTDLLDILTPIVKAWPSEFGLAANQDAIQVLGGYGYSREFPVERLYRDNRLNMIHEGTNGIQALDLLGRKAIANQGRALNALCREIVGSLKGLDLPSELQDARTAVVALIADAEAGARRAALLRADGNARDALAHASAYLNGVGHAIVGWLWLRMVAAGDGSPRAAGRRAACQYFAQHELPLASAWLQIAQAPPCAITKADAATL